MYPELWVMPGTGWTLKSYGFMMMVGFLSCVYLAMRRAMRVKCDPDAVLNVAFVALISGVIGSRVFYVVHYWKDSFADTANPWFAAVNLTQGGLEFLGGVLVAAPIVALYIWYKGWSIRLYADFVAIMIPWALGFGRIGCFLNGCCFGNVCTDAHQNAASVMAVEFPFGSPAAIRQWEERRFTVPAELIFDGFRNDATLPLMESYTLSRDLLALSPEAREKPFRKFEHIKETYDIAKAKSPDSETTRKLATEYAMLKDARDMHRVQILPLQAAQRYPSHVDPKRSSTYDEIRALAAQHPALWVHPTQLYATASGLSLALLLTAVFHRRKRHGVCWGLFLIGYPIARICLEKIRNDNPLDTFGLTVSQGISVAMILIGIIWLVVIYRFLPERSPAAVPWIPPEEEPAA